MLMNRPAASTGLTGRPIRCLASPATVIAIAVTARTNAEP